MSKAATIIPRPPFQGAGRLGRFGRFSAGLLLSLGMGAITSLNAAEKARETKSEAEQTSQAKPKNRPPTSIPWSKADTKIANHYIQILQDQPEYGRVLNLIWDLYRRHQQEALLLSYFKGAAEQADSTVAKVLYGHLLRKKNQLSEALIYYKQALSIDPDNLHALRGTAEILDQEEQYDKALVFYDHLVELLPSGHKDNLLLRLHRADLLKSANRTNEAVAVWNQLLMENPHDKILRTRMVALLLEAGRTDEAIRILQQQAQSEDPEEKLAALETLSSLYGFIDDFDRAIGAAEKAKSLLHFKDYRYRQFFAAEERLYERFERLKEFEEKLLHKVTDKGGSEQSLRDLTEFFRLTAKPKQEQIWVKRLIQAAPGNTAYSLRLARLLIENEEFQLAATHLDQLIRQQSPPPLSLVFMRSLAALNTEGKEAAEAVLNQYLTNQNNEASRPETHDRLLEFARYHYLDQVVESMLGKVLDGQKKTGDGNEGSGSLALARFFSERGRTQKARETIASYVKRNEGPPKTKAHRFAEAAKVYAELKMYDEAGKILQKSLEILPGNIEALLILASVQTESGKTDKAVATYNQVWQSAPDLAGQTEIDHRLFSLLRALVDKDRPAPTAVQSPLSMPPPQTTAEMQRLARAASLNPNTLNTDEPLPEKLLQFYETIKQDAEQQPDLRHKYRVAWWGFKLQDYREMYHQLSDLHQPDKPNIEVEKLMLELAELTGNTLLAGRKLKLLSEIDTPHESDYLRRWAEFRFKMEYQDQAVRLMEELAQRDDATLNTLKSLVEFYKRQGRTQDQLAVWRNAYERASIDEKRHIAKQLTTTLLEMGKVEEALDVQLDLIEKENDPVQQRRLFEAQLTLATRTQKLPWLKKRYSGLISQSPFEQFYPEALGKIHRATGDSKAAYQVLKKAYYMSDHDQSLLAQLGELADQSNDLKAAIYYRRQLIVSDGSKTNQESWKLLIDMLEKDLRVAEADFTRQRFEGKFARDAGFLRDSANYYLKTNRPEKAQAFFQKLVKLRPWDSALWLELGLLQKENGHHSEALAAFLKAIDTTSQDALPKDKPKQSLSYLPVINGGWHSISELRPKNSGLESLVTGIQEYRFLENEQHEELISWLRKPHPEFLRVPSPRTAIRLRAIEEAARLSKNDPPTLKKWITRWTNDNTLAAEEKLWATFYAGAFDLSQTILDKKMLPLTDNPSRFLHTLLSLRMGHAEALFEQTKPGTKQQGGSFSMLVTLLLLQESPEAISQQALEIVFRKTPITLSIARHLQNNLQLDGKLASAYKAGKALALTLSSIDADFMYKTAKSAEWLGHYQDRLFWLERSLVAIEPNAIRGLPVSFFGIASELYGLRESAEGKSALLDYLRQKIERHPAATRDTILESRLNLAMISGDRNGILASLRALTESYSEAGRPSHNPSARRGYAQIQHWIGMERLLNEHVRRLPANVSPEDFYDAMSTVNQVVVQDAAVAAQFQQFSMARLMWLLTDKSPPERRQRVAEFSSRLNDETLRLELARTLESRGFFREAIPVYHQLIKSDPNDFTLIRGFFTACRKARDYQPALKLIDRFLNREAPRSAGMTDLYLAQKHAHFLGLAGDLKALLSFGQHLPSAFTQNTSPSHSDLSNEYYRSLMGLYRENNQADEELDILQRLKARKGLTRSDHLSGGRLLLAQNQSEEALIWLEAMELNQSQPTIEIETIRLLADIYATSQQATKEKFAKLTRQALKYNNTELILHLAERLENAGHGSMVDSALLLSIRTTQSDSVRATLLMALIKARLNRGGTARDSGDQMQALLASLDPGSKLAAEWFAVIRDKARTDPDGFRKALASSSPLQQRPGSTILWKLSNNLITWIQADKKSSILQGLNPASMSEAELLCVLEQLAELKAYQDADKLLSGYTASHKRPLGFEAPSRLLHVLARLKNNPRVAALHAKLIAEPISETFRRRVRIRSAPDFLKRQSLPEDFIEAAYPDLAGSLYRTYKQALQKDGRVPGDFLAGHARLLMENGDFPAAENLLVQLFRRASSSDDGTILSASNTMIDLYQAWKFPDQQIRPAAIDVRLKRYYLSSGLQIKINKLFEMRSREENSARH